MGAAIITVVIGKIIHGWLYLGGRSIQEVCGEMMMGLSIYGVAVMDGSLYSRFFAMVNKCTYKITYFVIYNFLLFRVEPLY